MIVRGWQCTGMLLCREQGARYKLLCGGSGAGGHVALVLS